MQGSGRSLPSIALSLVGSIALYCLTPLTPATGQITPDDTLGAERSQVTSPIAGGFQIDGGATRGTNLFHSFLEFSVPTGGFAYFNNASNIQNIMTRVTGASVSNIDGVIAANGANVFLINPNGIIFGQNASLDVGGSFVASTASAVAFPNGIEFSATNPQTPSLLTISVPLGLQYGSNPGSIQVQGATLEVGVGQTLALVGGNVQLNGGALYTSVQPPGGRVELGGLAGEGTVGLVANGPYLGLSFPIGVPRGDVSLSNGAVVDVTAGGGGSISVNASNLTMAQGSQLLAGMLRRGAVDAVAGDIEINATGAIDLADESYISSDVFPRTQGQGGDVNITTSQLRVSGGSQVIVSTYSQGDGGNLTVNASQSVQLIGTSADGQFPSGLGALAAPGSSGKAGDVAINTSTLVVRDGGAVSAGTLGEGDGGNLTVNASQSVQLIGTSANSPGGLFALVYPGASGNAGELIINTGTLLVQDGASVNTSTLGEGDGGNLTVNASQSVQLIGESADGQFSTLGTLAQSGTSGNAGDLIINTGTLLVRDGAVVSTSTYGEGDGGNLTVNASQSVQLIGTSADGQSSVLGTSALPGSSGNAGDLTINTGTLLVRDGAQVSAGTVGEGDGGDLTVNASQQVQVIGTSAQQVQVDGISVQAPSGLYASAQSGSSGNAGDLTINTGTLLVRDGAQVTAGTVGEGDGGDLTVNASQQVQLIGESANVGAAGGLFTNAGRGARGNAGDLTINTDTLLVRDGAVVSAGTFGEGDGGNLTVNASQQVQVIGTSASGRALGGLYTSAERGANGNAGDLIINTGTLLVRDGAQVTASTSSAGDGGDLTVNASQQVQLIGTSADGRLASSLSAQANSGASGEAGDVTINTDTLLVRDGAQVSVRSFQGQAGNMTILANSLLLNQGRLFAETAKSDAQGGANIILTGLDLLRMDNESLISANALDQANGGNVTIDSTLIVATPPTGPKGSDITANAEQGNGGRVNVTTQGLFGIEFRPELTAKNDITVSSTFGLSGEFALNTPGVDPSRGLTNLPAEVVDASNQITQNCPAPGSQQESSFTITGAGGLPPRPGDAFDSPYPIGTVRSLPEAQGGQSSTNNSQVNSPSAPKASPAPPVEASGWRYGSNGEVILTAQAPNLTPHGSWSTSPTCH